MTGRVPPSRKRPWGVLVPPPWSLEDTAFVEELLSQYTDQASEIPRCLWCARNAMRSWALSEPVERANLFQRTRSVPDATERWTTATAQAPELGPAFQLFCSLYARPADIEAAELAGACQTVVDWAEERGLEETALQFAEAAASICPEDPQFANLAARLCRTSGMIGRAEVWYDRAVGLSRSAGNVLEYVNAHLGFGALLLERRAFRAAEKKIRRAGARAKQQGMRGPAAEAFHDAFAVAIVAEDTARAVHFARRAVETYPRHASRYPAFAYDLGYLLTSSGLFKDALRLLRLVEERIPSPAERLAVLGALARAAAGAGEFDAYRDAEERVIGAAPRFRATAAAAMYNVGEGARLLERWDAATEYADAAYELARRTNSKQVAWFAARLRKDAQARRPGRPAMSSADPLREALLDLADITYTRLVRWRGSTWRPRRT